jgi:hypothetical protein
LNHLLPKVTLLGQLLLKLLELSLSWVGVSEQGLVPFFSCLLQRLEPPRDKVYILHEFVWGTALRQPSFQEFFQSGFLSLQLSSILFGFVPLCDSLLELPLELSDLLVEKIGIILLLPLHTIQLTSKMIF